MPNEQKTGNPGIEENLATIEKNNIDKISQNADLDKDKLRVTYDAQTVDTKVKPSLK